MTHPHEYYGMEIGQSVITARLGVHQDGWIIYKLTVPPELRGTGAGRRMFAWICADADRAGVAMWLEIGPDGGLSFEQLEAWFKRLGFRWVRGSLGMMCRRPIISVGGTS